MKNRFDSLSSITSLSLTLTLSGCAWLSPSQWFSSNEQCDPDNRSGGLSAACAKESLATQERSSERLICMGDDTDQTWICGNNMQEVQDQLTERNSTVLAKNKAPSAIDISNDISPTNAAELGISTDASITQLALAKKQSVSLPNYSNCQNHSLAKRRRLQQAFHIRRKPATTFPANNNRSQE